MSDNENIHIDMASNNSQICPYCFSQLGNRTNELNQLHSNQTTSENTHINNLIGKKRKHDKSSKDNIINTIIGKLTNHIFEFINKLLKKNHRVELEKLDPKLKRTKNRQEKLDFINSTIKELLSKTISDEPSENERIIEEICKKDNNLELVFETKISDMAKKYREEIIANDFFKDFKRIKHDINEFKEKKESDEYIDEYECIAKKFEAKIKKIRGYNRK